MNRDDVMRMAREALNQRVDYTVWTLSTPHLEEFARLVAAAEREACALAAEAVVPRHTECGNKIAAAIRARGQG